MERAKRVLLDRDKDLSELRRWHSNLLKMSISSIYKTQKKELKHR